MRKAFDQKLIRHICTSFHDDDDALIKIIDTGYVESITLQYNMLDRQLEKGLAYAHGKNLGVVIMGPVGGGQLGVRSELLEKLLPGTSRVPELALRFVLSNPGVSVALSGMSDMRQVEENIATASDPASLSQQEIEAIDAHMRRLGEMAKLYCTGCGYCLPCPQDVAIPKIFERLNLGRIYGLWETAEKQYAAIGSNKWDSGKRADACVECGLCEEKCPQKIPIRRQLREAHERLSVEDSQMPGKKS
jgi:predicted aldo/keto reductase-like oxidoreductase